MCAQIEAELTEAVASLERAGNKPIPQAFLIRVKSMEFIQSRVKVLVDRAYDFVEAAVKIGANFEPGDVAVLAEMKPGRKNVAWKDEATVRAGQVAELKNVPFNANDYAESVKARCVPEPQLSVSLILR